MGSLLLAGLLGLLIWYANLLHPSWSFALSYLLLGVLTFAVWWKLHLQPVPVSLRPLRYGEAVLLFLLILSIRLPGFATQQILPEKVPMIFLVLFWAIWRNCWSLKDLGLQRARLLRQVLFGLGFVLLYWLLYQGVFALYTWVDVGIASVQWWTYPLAQAPIAGMDPLFFLALLFLFSNFAEELFFRGFLLREVRFGSRSLWGPFLFQALLFGLYHINYGLFPRGGGGPEWGYLGWYLAWTFLFGLGFGFAYLLSGSLISNTIFHVCANLLQSTAILLFVPVQSAFPTPVDYRNASIGIVLLIVTALFALILGILYALQRRKQRARPPT